MIEPRREEFVKAGSTPAAYGVIPLLLLADVGYCWGCHTDAPPWRIWLTAMLLGVFMVFVAVALGG